MKSLALLRILALLKRAVKALETIAEAQKTMAEGARVPERKRTKLAEVFVPSVADRNTEWQRRRDAEIYGEELPE